MMNINNTNSFSMISYNLGSVRDDHELLLASFYDPINKYYQEKFEAYEKERNMNLDMEKPRFEFYLKEYPLKKILEMRAKNIKDDPKMKDVLDQIQKDETLTLDKKFDKTKNIILERLQEIAEDPETKENIRDMNLAVLSRVTDENYAHLSEDERKKLLDDDNNKRTIVWQLVAELRESAETRANLHLIVEPKGIKPDVLFLQEIGDKKRLIVSQLTKNYAIHCFGEANVCDTGISLNLERFGDLNNYSFELSIGYGKKDCAASVATEKNTGKRFCFISAHIPGFSYKATGDVLEKQAKAGNQFCIGMLKEVKEIEKIEAHKKTPIDAVIIGADVNASPEKLAIRFKILSSEGFSVKRTGSPTNVHFMDNADKVREIDYFFSKTRDSSSSWFDKFKRIFIKHTEIDVTARSFPTFSFDMQNNMSDHKPIAGRVTVLERNSLFKRIKTYFSNLRIFKRI